MDFKSGLSAYHGGWSCLPKIQCHRTHLLLIREQQQTILLGNDIFDGAEMRTAKGIRSVFLQTIKRKRGLYVWSPQSFGAGAGTSSGLSLQQTHGCYYWFRNLSYLTAFPKEDSSKQVFESFRVSARSSINLLPPAAIRLLLIFCDRRMIQSSRCAM